jgi:hypothetical protein
MIGSQFLVSVVLHAVASRGLSIMDIVNCVLYYCCYYYTTTTTTHHHHPPPPPPPLPPQKELESIEIKNL